MNSLKPYSNSEKAKDCFPVKFLSIGFFLFSFFIFTPANSYAQEANFEFGQAERDKAALEKKENVEKEAKAKAFRDKLAEITYEEVLADPDNIDLNYKYAQQQVRDGNWLGASGTLERILIIQPNFAQVRLLYAIVQFRLDNLAEAKNELDQIKDLEMPDEVKQQVDGLYKQISKKQKKTHLKLTQSVGFQMDANKNAAPSSKRRLFFELPLAVQGSNSKQRDTSFLNITSLDFSHDLGFDAGHELVSNFTYYQSEQTKLDSLDLHSISYDVGIKFKNQYFDFTPKYTQGYIYLSRQTFLRTQGMDFNVDVPLGERAKAFTSFKLDRQDYRNIDENPTARQRKGRYLEYELGARTRLFNNQSVQSSIGYGNKSAEEDINAYQKLFLKLSHTLILPKSIFVINSADLDFDYYDEEDQTVAGRERHDTNFRYRATLGIPFGTIPLLNLLPTFFDGITLTTSYEYFRSLSNITNYTYRNHKGQAMLTKTIEF